MDPATLIAGVVFLATLLWAYVAVVAVEWIWHLRRTEPGARVAMVVDLLSALVPVVIAFIAVVFASVLFGFRSGVVLLALVVPGGLLIALRSQVTAQPAPWQEPIRLGASLGVLCAVTLWRTL